MGQGHSQNCDLTLSGRIFDEASKAPLSYVNVFFQETSDGAISDDNGNFTLQNVCPGEYHLIVSHIGCATKKIHLHIFKDTTFAIGLLHTTTSLDGVVIEGKSHSHDHQPGLSIDRQSIEDNANQSLSGILEKEAGVYSLKNGSGISKPVIHGLYGNRLTILNNGIAQMGQQWGNDHSPEIDPFVADNITVLKAVSGMEYGGGNLGGVILLQPRKIENEPHLHGQVNYAFETNGRGHNVNARLEKFSPFLAWRVSGTYKKSGDKKTADYYLNNTGSLESNLSLQLEKKWGDKLSTDLYFSTFNTELGILRGSHIGNLTDLEQALENKIPFFTEPDFSYDIDAPRQRVSHHLGKLKANYIFNQNESLELVLASQINDRKEFDVRRSGRTDVPALSLFQLSYQTDLKYTRYFEEDLKIQLGNQNIFIDNTNDPETGILPLIPDYFSSRIGWFARLSKGYDLSQIDLGVRYDYEFQDVVTISSSLPREIIRYENNFHNISGLFALRFNLPNKHSVRLNSGYATRNPAINERYSNGLHQGVSGIEEGDVNLRAEGVFKNTIEYEWLPSAKFSFNALVYHQWFQNYIFLSPQEETRLTIRGAFPVFRYEQTDAEIYGLDVSTQFQFHKSFLATFKYSYLRGRDIEKDIPLIFMPPNSLHGSVVFRNQSSLNIPKLFTLEESEIELNGRFVYEQSYILEDQDFVSPPPAYFLLGLKLSTNIIFPHYKIRWFAKATNMLNTEYRDYLNRQRYFADDLGISVVTGINIKF